MTPAESAPSSYPDALPVGTVLGEFAISKVIGVGGFGIVYTAHDTMLDRTVAIKEYYPVTIAGRANVDNTVLVRALHNQEAYAAGVQSFLQEARLQARFSHPAMLEVYRVWEQNATAYMAMRYYPGSSLRSLRLDPACAQIFDEASIRQITSPIFDALQLLHSRGVLHRDVSPDNILMLPSGAPVLLDFGAARSVEAGAPQSLTTVLKPGYAPIEQYADDGAMEQGPWTDVYALGAVLHFLAVGSPPSQAVTRIMGGTLKGFEDGAAGRFSGAFIAAVKAGLEVHGHDRIQSVAALREALGWTSADSEERPVSMLLTSDSFPSQVPHTATKTAQTAKAPSTSKTTKTAKTGKNAQTAAQQSSQKTIGPADDATQVLSPAAIKKLVTQPPAPAAATAAGSAASTIKPEPRPAANDAAARSAVKTPPQAAAPKAASPPPKATAQPHPRRLRATTVAISAGVILGLVATIYAINARKMPRPPITDVAPQIIPASAPPDAVPPAAAVPTPVESPPSLDAVKNSLEIKADSVPKAASVGGESKSTTPSPDAPARANTMATPRATQAQRGSGRNSEKSVTASPVEDAVEKRAATPKARATASERTAPDICGQILAKLSLGGVDVSDSERNQLRGCK